MDNKKFEQLIDLIINENEEQARALFHDIVVEKSREIYESMMDEEGMMNQPSGQVEDLLDEINTEEEGMSEGEDDIEFDDEAEEDGEELKTPKSTRSAPRNSSTLPQCRASLLNLSSVTSPNSIS